MNILITGAAGFIGSHTAERLSGLGHRVVGIDNLSPYYDVSLKKVHSALAVEKAVTMFTADLNDGNLATLLGTDFHYIFHFAAQPGISDKVSFSTYVHNNINATEQLLLFARQNNNLRMFINISTSSVYGLNATRGENHVAEPVSYYGISKLAAEQLAMKYARTETFNCCSLRLYSVYGPRERPDKLFTRLIKAAINGEKFTLYRGSENHIRSFTFVDDIVDGIVSVINKEKICSGQIINLGSGQQYTTQEGIDCVNQLTAGNLDIQFSGNVRSGDQLHTRAVITKAHRLLGYNPCTTLPEGLQKQLAWQHYLDEMVHANYAEDMS